VENLTNIIAQALVYLNQNIVNKKIIMLMYQAV